MTSPNRQQHIQTFLAAHGFKDAQQVPLAGDASFRRYTRIQKPGKTALLMDAPPGKENTPAYLAIAEHLYGRGYSAPAILAHEVDAGLMLLEDFGDDSFTALLKREPQTEQELYESAIDILVQWHRDGARFADRAALTLPAYDYNLLMQEARLFSDWYLPQVVGKEKSAELGAEYCSLWARILSQAALSNAHFVHRDYHADNLFWLSSRETTKRVGLIDFQDAVYGDVAYDVVSLLEDARRDVPPALVEAMLERYLQATGSPRERFLTAYDILGAQRNSKIIGIFVRLAARDGKYQYLNYLPRVWQYLERDLKHPALADLQRWLDEHIAQDKRGVINIRHTSQELALIA